jgi:hypothetical protein
MITVAGQTQRSPAAVVAWLLEALDAGPAHPAERSPAERLRPALQAAAPADRDALLVGLVEALDTADDALREHLLYSLKGFDSEPLRDALAKVLQPAPAAWLGHNTPTGGLLARTFFYVLGHGPGNEDDRLILGLRVMARQHGFRDRALGHFVTFRPKDHGFQMLCAHLDEGGDLAPDQAGRFGRRFGRDAPEHLTPLAHKLAGYPVPVRAAFAEGAARKILQPDADALREALGLSAGPR